MIFNLQAGEVKTLPVVSNKYPEDITVKAGENAVFSAVIEKDGVPTVYTYQWYVNNSLVKDATTAVYTRKTDSDNGVYSVYCEITNKAGVAKTRTATLTVNALPKLDSTKPENASCYLGESKTLEVVISEHGYPKEYTYQWYQNGSAISGATSPSYAYKPTSDGTHTLHCEVKNSAGTVTSRKASITVKNVLTLIPGSAFSGVSGATQISNGAWNFYAVNGARMMIAIDVTKFKTMTIQGSFSFFKGTIRVGLFSDQNTQITGYGNGWADPGGTINNTWDISNVNGTVYFGVYGQFNHEETQYLNVTLTSVVFKG